MHIADSSSNPVIWNTVQWKDIDPNSLLIGQMFRSAHNILTVFAAQLTITPAISFCICVILKIKTRRIYILAAGIPKHFIFVSQQCNICIIVPGDEPSMPNGSQHGSCDDCVAYSGQFAYTAHFTQQFQKYSLQPLQISSCQ